MPTRRTYGSYDDGCAAAHALDLVGDRWALIVVRELVLGPKRFADLRADVPGISPSVLAQRLRELEEVGVVVHDELPPPARVNVYDLTPWGRELEDVLQALGRWGAQSPRMPHHARVTDDTAILASRTMGAAAAERATREVTLRLLLSARDGRDREYTLHLAPGACTVERSPAVGADATVRSDSGTWTDVLLHGLSPDAAVAAGRMSVEGDRSALDDVVTAFPLLADA
jgi:DNA-binding HxlR family transcriptional regulator/putative sterol carrier protein